MKSVVRLERRYDVSRLRADLDRATAFGHEHENRGDYHDGGWSAIPLVAVDGRTDAEGLRWAGWRASYEPTPILEQTPYFREIVESFRCPKQRVRLLRLRPGAVIHEHRDDGDGWAVGKVRLHIPIITHDEVYFYVDGRRVMMGPGELWYCDFTRPHRVHNAGDIGRVHLVLDLLVDPWLRQLFPSESLVERLQNAAQRTRYQLRYARYALARRTGPAIFVRRARDARRRRAA
jgi:hypothetical protein